MAFFRYFNFTTCIDFNELEALEQQITQLLEQEDGCHRLFQLPQLNCAPEQLRLNYPEAKLPNLWIVSLFEGGNGWTVIKTFPTGLLCRRASGAERPRLAQLTVQLNCDAFHLRVHRDVEGFLLEADASGRTFLSGCVEEAPDQFKLYEEQSDLPDLFRQFSLIDVPESMQEAMKINESPEVKTRQSLIEWLAESPDDAEEYYDLILEEPGYTQRIDLALADLIDPERDYWFLKNSLADKVYNELGELEAIGARLLYFHPPTSYQPPIEPKFDFSRLSDAIPQSEDD